MLIVIAALHKLDIHQMNIKTAFLNDDLNKEIYMEQREDLQSKTKNTKYVNW